MGFAFIDIDAFSAVYGFLELITLYICEFMTARPIGDDLLDW